MNVCPGRAWLTIAITVKLIVSITIDGLKNYNPTKMANEFGKFYSMLGENLAKNIKQGPISIDYYLKQI